MNYFILPGMIKGYTLAFNKYRSHELIIHAVCNYFLLTIDQVYAKNRKREIVTARQVSMWLMKKYTKMSLKSIGGVFHLDHTTVIHSVTTINNLIETDPVFKNDVDLIEISL